MQDRIESIIREKTKELVSDIYNEKELFTRDATFRKIKAARFFSPLLKKRLKEKYPSLDWDVEAANFAVLNTLSPDSINRDTKFMYGVAIYILDSIATTAGCSEVLDDLDNILPPDSEFENMDEGNDYYFYDLYEEIGKHPYYSEDLLLLVTRVLSCRNSDFVTYGRDKNCLFVLDKSTVSFGPLDPIESAPKTREIFEKLLTMIPPESIEEAKEAYISLFWTLIDKYLEARGKVQKQKEKLENLVEYGKLQFKERAALNLQAKESNFLEKSIDLSLGENMLKLKELVSIKDDFEFFFTAGLTAYPESRNRYTQNFEDIEIDDPYKIVAGYFFLLNENNDYPWLLGPAMSALSNGANLLPWKYDCGFSDNSWENIKKEKKKRKKHSSSFYKIKLDGNMIGVPDYKYYISPAQLLCLYTDSIPPRFIPSFPYSSSFDNNMEKDLTKETLDSYIVLHASSEKFESTVNEWDTSMSHYEFVKDLERKVENLKTEISNKEEKKIIVTPVIRDDERIKDLEKEINRLRKAIDREIHTRDRVKNEKSTLENEIKAEREELYSLRELIFSKENGEEEPENEKTDSVSFPISTNLRHLAIGGHEEWLKKIKTLAPDVTFLGDRVPPKELLRHTDVLWLQTHAGMSHSLFYKIIEDAKTLKIPIKYFTEKQP